MIDRYLIRYFLAVVDSGNFTRAAERMNVSQPTLSAGIAKMEKLLGAQLFNRNNRRIHLTDAGTRYLPFARRIESEFNRSEASLQDIHPVRVLKIGILNTVSSDIVKAAVTAMLAADHSARIEILDGSERELVHSISRERVDVALTLVERGGDRFSEEVLFEEGYFAALPDSHPQAGNPVLNAEDLADSVMIVRRQCEALSETSRYFTERGVRPFFAYRSTHDDRVMDMGGRLAWGLTIAPESHMRSGIRGARMNGFDLRRKVGFMFAAPSDPDALNAMPGFAAFRRVLRASGKKRSS